MGTTAESNKTKQTVRDHLRELRRRIAICVTFFVLAGLMLFFIYEPIISILSNTLGSQLYYNTPAGGFSFVMRICTTGAIVLTIPIIMFNSIKFIKPAFEKILTTKRIVAVSLFSSLFATMGAAFAYLIILPESIHFFGDFNVQGLSALISADEYLSFVTSMIIVFAIIFQVPLLMMFVDSIKRIPPKKLLDKELWVVMISIVVAIITPFNYDILSSLVVAVPIVGLYNLSIVVIIVKHLLFKKNVLNAKIAQIIKPTAIEEFWLSETTYMDIREDVINVSQERPVQPMAIETVRKDVVLDFKASSIQKAQIDKAAWRQRRQAQIEKINSGARAFSDIMPGRINRVLASQ